MINIVKRLNLIFIFSIIAGITNNSYSYLPSPVEITAIKYSPDDKYILIYTYGGVISLWDEQKGKLLKIDFKYYWDPIEVFFTPDGKYIAFVRDYSIKILDSMTFNEIRTINFSKYLKDNLAFSDNGQFIACYSSYELQIYNFNTANIVNTIKINDRSIRSISFSPDNKTIACGLYSGKILIYDLTTKLLKKELDGHSNFIYEVKFINDGKHLLSKSADKTIKKWDIETGRIIYELKQELHLSRFCNFSPDGKYIIVVYKDSIYKIFETNNGKVLKTMNMKSHQVGYKLGISNDNSRFAVIAGSKGFLKIFDFKTGALLKEFELSRIINHLLYRFVRERSRQGIR